MIPQSFTLGGAQWKVKLIEVPGYRWKCYLPVQELHLAPEYQGTVLRKEIVEKCFWEAIAFLLIDRVMLRKSSIWESNRLAVGSLVSQVMMQLKRNHIDYVRAKIEYIVIGAAEVKVSINDSECDKRKMYGEYDSNSEEILLQSKGVTEERFMIHTDEFILRVLIHECLHAIAAQLGLHTTKWNSEHHVNTMAFFLTEILLTLKYIEDVNTKKSDSI